MLDEQIEAVLAGMLAAPGPPSHEIPIEQARVSHRCFVSAFCREYRVMTGIGQHPPRHGHLGDVEVLIGKRN